MAQPNSILNTRGQSTDTLYAADGTPLIKLGIGEVVVSGITPAGGWQAVATHQNGGALAASEGVVLIAGKLVGGTTVTPLAVDSNGRAVVNSVPTQGNFTDKSGTITLGGTAQTLAAVNVARRYLMIQNIDAAEDLWINFTDAAAVATAGSIQIKPGATFTLEGSFVSTQLVSVIAATTGHKFTAKEG